MSAGGTFRLLVQPDFAAWRALARTAVIHGIAPERLHFQDSTATEEVSLFETGSQDHLLPDVPGEKAPHVPKSFVEKAEVVSYHRDPDRWNLLYRMLWRLQTNADLLHLRVDSDVNLFFRMEQQVRHDNHKMHAFVRFRRVETDDGQEAFVSWYQPQHRVLPMAAPFFAERFAVMRWSILTPDGSAVWDPDAKQLSFGPPLPREMAPSGDDLETLWKSYYGSIFNPARLNPSVMKSHMPVRYWGNLPEVELLPTLMATAGKRVEGMLAAQSNKPSAAPYVPTRHTLPAIHEALPACRGCELYCHATQVVPGRGNPHASLLLVGEQPGDQEDLQGLPFVGPAGKLLQRAMSDAGIEQDEVYMTNAVKHFKFVQRGKLRLHQNPRLSEITACRPWLLAELDALKPRIVLCLGASAAKSLLGGTFALMRDRGKVQSTPYAERVMATVHPSAVLRARDEPSREALFRHLREDLMAAHRAALQAA